MKWTISLFVTAVMLSGCAPKVPTTTPREQELDLSTDDVPGFDREDLAVAEPVELPEGTVDPDLVGSWVAVYSVDQEKYDEREQSYRDVVDVMVADMNASQSTYELMADGTYTHSASIPINLTNPGSEMAGNSLMNGVWCVSEGKLVLVLRETAFSDPNEELPEPTPINKRMARAALATIELSEDRKSFSSEQEDRDSPYYFPMVWTYHKVD